MDVRTSDFTIVKNAKCFVTEASDLGLPPGKYPKYLKMMSTKTMKVAFFHAKHPCVDDSAVTYVPTPETVATHPNLKGWEVAIHND